MEDSIMAYNILIGNLGRRGHLKELGEVCKLTPKRISDKKFYCSKVKPVFPKRGIKTCGNGTHS
jgi:hypothetical protein